MDGQRMKSVLQRYRRCTNCHSLNMSHRLVCYKCRNHLPAALAPNGREEAIPIDNSAAKLALSDSRSFTRKDMFMGGVYLENDSGARQPATIRNLSATGAQIWCTHRWTAGAAVR